MRSTINALALLLSLTVNIQTSLIAQSLNPELDPATGKFGYRNKSTNKWQISPQFNQADEFNLDRAIVELNGKKGLINKNGNWIVKPQFIELQYDSLYLFKTEKDTIGLLNSDGKILIQGMYDHIQFKIETNSSVLLKNDLYGYWDLSGVLIPPFSRYEIHFENGLAYFNSGDSIGYINPKGERIFKTNEGKLFILNKNGILHSVNNKEYFYTNEGKLVGEYQQVIQAGKTWLAYKKNEVYGIANYEGTSIGEFEELLAFNAKGVSIARKENKYGVIDTLNQIHVPFESQSIQPFGQKFNRYTGNYVITFQNVLYSVNNLLGLLNDKGEVIHTPSYTNAYLENDILIREENDTLSITDLATKKDIPLKDIFIFNQGKAIYFFEKNNQDKYGLINKDGRIALSASFKSIRSLYNGLFIAESDQGVGIMDTAATLIVPTIYKELLILNDLAPNRNPRNILFDNYVYAITKQGKAGVYSREGKKIVDTIWNNISVYDDDGMNFFGQDSKLKWQIILKDGVVNKVSLDNPVLFENKKAIAQRNGKYGIIGIDGKQVVPFKYSQLLEQDNGMILCKAGKNWGILSEEGKVIVKPQFKIIFPVAADINLAFKKEWGVLRNGVFAPGFKELKPIKLEENSVAALDKTSLNYISLKGIDEYNLELFASDTKLSIMHQKVNEFILNKVSPLIVSETSLNKAITIREGKVKDKLSDEFIGKGVEILNSSDSTVTLNFYEDISGKGFNKVEDSNVVISYKEGSLSKVKLAELFSAPDYSTYLNEIIASRLREADYRIIPSPSGDRLYYDENFFQIAKDGLILKVNEKVLDLTFNLVGPEVIIAYKELDGIVKKDGVLREFYK